MATDRFVKRSKESQILTDLKNVDINKLSPVDALNLIHEWKDKYK